MEFQISNSTLDAKGRIELLKTIFMKSDLKFDIKHKNNDNFHSALVDLLNISNIDFLIKNIVNSGWKEKPHIKRIQVPSFKVLNFKENSLSNISVFFGICYVNQEIVLALWNPFEYAYHKTNCSCYIKVQDLAEGYYRGFLKVTNKGKVTYICKSEHLIQALRSYVEDNYKV